MRFADNARVAVVEADAAWLAGAVPEVRIDTILCLNVLEHIGDDALVLRQLPRLSRSRRAPPSACPRAPQAVRQDRSERQVTSDGIRAALCAASSRRPAWNPSRFVT